MPGQLQAVVAAFAGRSGLPVAEHGLVQEWIGAEQRQVEHGPRQYQTRVRSLFDRDTQRTQRLAGRLRGAQADPAEDLPGRFAQTP
ncbi:hypothetical protein D3C80_1970100 [compost metagenome]